MIKLAETSIYGPETIFVHDSSSQLPRLSYKNSP